MLFYLSGKIDMNGFELSMSDRVVKHNDLIEASHNLDLVEQRLIFLAIIKARKHSDDVAETLKSEFVIYANDYVKVFNVERHTAYESLKNGVKGLLDAKFLYRYENKNNNLAQRGYNLASWVEYVDNEACVSIKFSPDVVPLIIGLNNKFTSYELQQIINLQSRYAIRLYEILIRWRDTGKLIISLEDLRFSLGVKNEEYQLMSNFKNRVLDLAVSQVNKYTDIETIYEQKKNGRKIIGFEFTFTIKREQTEEPDFFSDEKSRKTKPKKAQLPLPIIASLSEQELLITKSKADEYIQKKQITDEGYKANIHKLAEKEGWGLEQIKEEQEDYNKQNREVLEKIAKEKAIEEANKIASAEQEKLNQAFIEKFEALPELEQKDILLKVRELTKNLPIINKSFEKAVEENQAHKDVMYRAYFKQVMEKENN